MRRINSANANVAAVVAVIRQARASVVRGTRMDRLHEMYLKKHLKTGKSETCDFTPSDSAFDGQPVLPPSRVLGLDRGRLQASGMHRPWQSPSAASSQRWAASSPLEHLIAG
jgi:hypothetical protein